MDSFSLLIVVVVLAVAFDLMNGFHDAANAIATSVSTRVLTPRVAIGMAAVLNFVGALTGTAVAATVGKGLVEPQAMSQLAIACALLSAFLWDLLTWYFGLPTSSSHALMASIIGAGFAIGGQEVLVTSGITTKVLLPLFLSPLLAFGFGWLLTNVLYFIFQKVHPGKIGSLFRRLQIVSAAWMAYSHGSNDAQKTMGIITMALVSYYELSDFHIPIWVILLCALAMAVGTAAGGWRIIKTMGMRIVHLTPFHGFAAEAGAGTLIEIASRFGVPLSTTHVISSTIMGVGASQKFSAVRWGVAGNIIIAWILTLPACALMGYAFVKLTHIFVD